MTQEQSSTRRSRDELRELVIGAALELLESEGPGLGTDVLSYQRVFDHLEATEGVRVTRASVHERIWASQRDFQLDVLHATATFDVSTSNDYLDSALEDWVQACEQSDVAPDSTAGRELLVLWIAQRASTSTDATRWFQWVRFLCSAMLTSPESDPAVDGVRRVLAESYVQVMDSMTDAIRGHMAHQPHPPSSEVFGEEVDKVADIWTRLGVALHEGVSVQRILRSAVDEVRHPASGHPSTQEWGAVALGALYLNRFFLPEPVEGSP